MFVLKKLHISFRPLQETDIQVYDSGCLRQFYVQNFPDLLNWRSLNLTTIGPDVHPFKIPEMELCNRSGYSARISKLLQVFNEPVFLEILVTTLLLVHP